MKDSKMHSFNWVRSRKRLCSRKPTVQRRRRLFFESLESRRVLAAVNWDGGGDGTSFLDPLNWDSDLVPTAGDDAFIDVAASDPTINVGGTASVNSLTTNEAIVFSGGTFTVGTTVEVNSAATLSGGTIVGATITGTAALAATSSGGTLDGVTLDGNLDVTSGTASLTVSNDLTLNGQATLSYDDAIYFNGTQTLGGTGSVVFTGNAQYSALVVNPNDTTLTIGPGITIRGGSTNGSYYSGAVIGRSDYKGGGSNSHVILQGTIDANVSGQKLYVRTTGNFTNDGTIKASNGGLLGVDKLQGDLGTVAEVVGSTVSLTGNYTVNEPVVLSSGASLTLGGTWSNVAGITTTSSTLHLAGAFTTANVGTIDGSGSTIAVTGTRDNTGGTVVMDAAANWVVS
ncbi:MAG: hypothetical protein O3C40_29280 [Planctomycetota bacterium]|nr:hypothetical protein [Planctomycetota bacterium]